MLNIILLIVLLVAVVASQVSALACMGGRGACMASCMAQNCATGYCPNGTRGVCVCSRCGTGPRF